MTAAADRVVVQVTSIQKQAMARTAKRELMRGAVKDFTPPGNEQSAVHQRRSSRAWMKIRGQMSTWTPAYGHG